MSAYRAPAWLPGGHAQTIYPSLFPPPPVRFERERWTAPDDDFVDVDFFGGRDAPRLLALFHGLEGSSASHYVRAAAAALPAGWRLAVPHFRGCSGEPNRLARAYHSGDSEELDWILRKFSTTALYAAGVSLGGNALLKWLGERGEAARAVVRRGVAVSAPVDVAAAGDALDRGINRLLYTNHFLATLKPKSLAKLELFPGIYDAARVRAARTFRAFDDVVTAPVHGFRDTDDYWRRASSFPWLASVRVPTLVLNARNDPFLPEARLLAATRDVSPEVRLEFPDEGGHAGFLSGPFPGRHDWLPRRIFEFLSE